MKLVQQEDWKDRYLRAVAELDNFRKRTIQEKALIADNTKIEIVEELLPIADSVQSAMKLGVEGIDAVYEQLKQVFEKIGVKEIVSIAQSFDPNFHNAIMHEQDEGEGENKIVEEFQKGYTLGERVVRHSLVKVVN